MIIVRKKIRDNKKINVLESNINPVSRGKVRRDSENRNEYLTDLLLNKKNLNHIGHTSNNGYNFEGMHNHEYTIHSDGSVTIHRAFHPNCKTGNENECGIYHSHKYVGLYPYGYIEKAASDCWTPNQKNCLEKYSNNGVGPHAHSI
jgi:hypothetical protein